VVDADGICRSIEERNAQGFVIVPGMVEQAIWPAWVLPKRARPRS